MKQKFDLAPISYRISWGRSWRQVDGFAVNSPTGVRYCIRRDDGVWRADDYDTGFGLRMLLDPPFFPKKKQETIKLIEAGLMKKGLDTYRAEQQRELETLAEIGALEGIK